MIFSLTDLKKESLIHLIASINNSILRIEQNIFSIFAPELKSEEGFD